MLIVFYHVSKDELFVIQETAGVETWTALNVSAVESKRSSGIAQTSALVPGTTRTTRPRMTTKKHRNHWWQKVTYTPGSGLSGPSLQTHIKSQAPPQHSRSLVRFVNRKLLLSLWIICGVRPSLFVLASASTWTNTENLQARLSQLHEFRSWSL